MNNQELNTIQHISLAVDFWNKMDTNQKINLINRFLKTPEYSKTLSHISLADVADVINFYPAEQLPYGCSKLFNYTKSSSNTTDEPLFNRYDLSNLAQRVVYGPHYEYLF